MYVVVGREVRNRFFVDADSRSFVVAQQRSASLWAQQVRLQRFLPLLQLRSTMRCYRYDLLPTGACAAPHTLLVRNSLERTHTLAQRTHHTLVVRRTIAQHHWNPRLSNTQPHHTHNRDGSHAQNRRSNLLLRVDHSIHPDTPLFPLLFRCSILLGIHIRRVAVAHSNPADAVAGVAADTNLALSPRIDVDSRTHLHYCFHLRRCSANAYTDRAYFS